MMNACPRCLFLALPVLAALGCSSPVPLPPQAGISISIQQQTGCPVPGKTYEIGNPTPPSTLVFGDSAIDGNKGYKIKCAVRGTGPFTFSGSINGLSIDSEHVPLTVDFAGGQVGADKSGTATVTVLTRDLGSAGFSSDAGACAIHAIDIKPGSMWATFSCPQVKGDLGKVCAVGTTSVIVFENCSQ